MAIATGEDPAAYRHPAARAIHVMEQDDSCLDLVQSWLRESHLNLLLFDMEIPRDFAIAETIARQVSLKEPSINVAITGACFPQCGVCESSFKATVMVPKELQLQRNRIVHSLLVTMMDILYRHAIIGIEYMDVINILGTGAISVTSFIKEEMLISNLASKASAVFGGLKSKAGKRIICFKCAPGQENGVFHAIGEFELGFGDSLLSIVPANIAMNSVELTVLGLGSHND